MVSVMTSVAWVTGGQGMVGRAWIPQKRPPFSLRKAPMRDLKHTPVSARKPTWQISLGKDRVMLLVVLRCQVGTGIWKH